MWVSKWRWERLNERLNTLEQEVHILKARSGAYVADGRLVGWHGPCPSLIDSVNALGAGLGFKFKEHKARPASIEAVREEKSDA